MLMPLLQACEAFSKAVGHGIDWLINSAIVGSKRGEVGGNHGHRRIVFFQRMG
jgi:hypothetical protein